MSELLIFFSKSRLRLLFAHNFSKNERFAQKTDKQIPNPVKNKNIMILRVF